MIQIKLVWQGVQAADLQSQVGEPVIPRNCGRICAWRGGNHPWTEDKQQMSCGWLKNLEVLAERPCAADSIGSRNLSPLKTGSAPRETKGTLEGLGDRRGRREADTGGAAPQTASEQSACQGGGVIATLHAVAE